MEQCHRLTGRDLPGSLPRRGSGSGLKGVCADAGRTAAENIEPASAVPGLGCKSNGGAPRLGTLARPTSCCKFAMRYRRMPQSHELVGRPAVAGTPATRSTWNRGGQKAERSPRSLAGSADRLSWDTPEVAAGAETGETASPLAAVRRQAADELPAGFRVDNHRLPAGCFRCSRSGTAVAGLKTR